jgi:probable HAF family extracellular repeat protein
VQNIGSLSSVAFPVPSAMNDAGLIVGDDNSSSKTHHAFVWIPSSGMKDLGTSGIESGALGITNSPTTEGTRIVGTSYRQSVRRAVVWLLR